MARPGWYNDNRNRAYPFARGTVGVAGAGGLLGLPPAAIVDAGFIAGPASGYDPARHAVRLARLARTATTLVYTFACDAPGLVGYPLVFARDLASDGYQTHEADSAAPPPDGGSLSSLDASEPGGDCALPRWEGFLVTADELDIDWLPDEATIEGADGEAVIEPSLVQSLAAAGVESVSIANADRARAGAPAGCPPPVWEFSVGVIYPYLRCGTGPVRLVPGYNALVVQDSAAGRIALGARQGAGAGEPCSEVPLNVPEKNIKVAFPPRPLSGGPWCKDVIRAVNGVGGPDLPVSGGAGVTVTPDPAGHRVVVSVGPDAAGLGGCHGDYVRVSESL